MNESYTHIQFRTQYTTQIVRYKAKNRREHNKQSRESKLETVVWRNYVKYTANNLHSVLNHSQTHIQHENIGQLQKMNLNADKDLDADF